eukprot:g9089.t1
MKTGASLASSAGALTLWLASQGSSAVACTSSPLVVDDAAGAQQLAEAIDDCSGRVLNVSWVGFVTVEASIVVGDTTVYIAGTPDGSSVVDGAGEVFMFDMFGGELHLSDLSFANGTGGSGGAIRMVDAVLTAENCNFTGNHAHNFGGGAIYAQSSNVTLDGCEFLNNTAPYGGGLYLFLSVLKVAESTFAGNIASSGFGGAFELSESTFSLSRNLVVEGNRAAAEGGGIALFSSSRMQIQAGGRLVLEANEATRGGGGGYVAVSTLEVLVGGRIEIARNAAGNIGGGLFVDSSVVSFADQVIFVDNNAGSGGGMYVQSSPELQIGNTSFTSNRAATTGGAMSLFSVGDETAHATISNCSFDDDEAGDVGGAVFILSGYVDIINSEFDGNTAGRAGGAILASGTIRVDGSSFERNHAPLGPAVSNVLTVELNDTWFRDNTLWCDDDGMFLDWKNASAYEVACDACPDECSYCSTSNPDSVQLCEPVMEHTTSTPVNGTLETLELARGYWRSSTTSTEIRECYETDSCVGGTEEYCATGYDGPFCAVCAQGYAPGLGYTCSECNGGRKSWTIAVGVILLCAGAVVVALSVRYLGSTDNEPATKKVRACMEGVRASQGFKIVIVSWQIVSQFSSVVSVTYPDVYETFIGYVDVIDLDLTWMTSAECWIPTNFFATLLVITVVPLVVSGFVVLSFAMRSRGCSAADQDRRSRIKNRHATFLYLISFLVYSSASSTVFQTFTCDDLDTGESFLRADHSIQCYTTKHRVYMAYAGLMCLVYPIGIPSCYAFVLYQARDGLKSSDSAVRDNATVLRALHEPYRPDRYYYEVVECFRRVMLSGVVVFILPNTAGQVMTTFLLSLFFFALFTVLDPYEDPAPGNVLIHASDTWLARVGHAIVMMSMFAALVAKVDTESDDGFSQDVFAGALVLINCALFVAVVVEACMMCSGVVEISEERGEPVRRTSATRGGGV